AGSVQHLPTPSDSAEVPAVFAAALAPLHGQPALVAITGASNVTGEVLPIATIVEAAHRYGARVVVDAAQLAPHRAIDIATLDVDYVAFSGHKLYAPFGAGALVGRRDWLDDAPPYLSGGGATYHVTVDDVGWYPAPARHEAGSPNVIGAVAIAAACDTLTATGFDAIARHDEVLTMGLLDGLDRIDGVEVVSLFGADHDRVGIVTVQTQRPAAIVAAALSAEHGIATRDGAFCAHPLLHRLLPPLPTGHVPNALRVSVGVGSRADDVTVLLDALGSIAAEGPQWKYHAPAGRYIPNPDPRPRPSGIAG
ncbi:MAG TPA: aminotransferase class V-fold PLP-dependent enzyme, partial [Ilumatobacteraceae bacterium]|nr:aminotransferase class V-fold PLP-dependent enzyme [Ilumatobacteraceae bacterium]